MTCTMMRAAAFLLLVGIGSLRRFHMREGQTADDTAEEEASQSMRHRRILIVQIDNRNLSSPVPEGVVPYWKHSHEINKKYASNHGYDYKYISFSLAPEGRHNAWAHVAIVRDILRSGEYDYVMKLDSDAMFATNMPLESLIEFRPFDRGDKDILLGLDAKYYDLYECPRVHNLTTVERVCDTRRKHVDVPFEALKITDADKCSSGILGDVEDSKTQFLEIGYVWEGLAAHHFRRAEGSKGEDSWPKSWAASGLSELPPGATRSIFDRYGIAERRKDLLNARWMHDPDVNPALVAMGAFNSGVYLAKASAASLAFFDDWWGLPSAVCTGGALAPRFEPALRHLTAGEAKSGACPLASEGRNAFTLRPVGLAPLSCADGSLKHYLSGLGAGGSPVYEQPALSLVLPEHMPRVEAYDAWDFNGPFSRLVWHPYGPAKTWHQTVHWFDALLDLQNSPRGGPQHSSAVLIALGMLLATVLSCVCLQWRSWIMSRAKKMPLTGSVPPPGSAPWQAVAPLLTLLMCRSIHKKMPQSCDEEVLATHV
jgi:hypothetical protein